MKKRRPFSSPPDTGKMNLIFSRYKITLFVHVKQTMQDKKKSRTRKKRKMLESRKSAFWKNGEFIASFIVYSKIMKMNFLQASFMASLAT